MQTGPLQREIKDRFQSPELGASVTNSKICGSSFWTWGGQAAARIILGCRPEKFTMAINGSLVQLQVLMAILWESQEDKR